MLRTIDGGNNWQIIQAGDSYPLFSIDVIDSLHIAAAGYSGTGYPAKNIYSSDGGYTWISGGTLTTSEINCIKYISLDTGYVVMSNIGLWKTTNRGQNWTITAAIGEYELQYFKQGRIELKLYKTESNFDVWQRLIINDNFADVFFVSEQKGYVISGILSFYKALYKTTDGGVNWASVPDAPGGNDLLFLDSLTGFIGSNQIYKTTDGGVTWYVPNGGQGGAGKIFFINETIGWAVRSNVIYKTADRGENWFTQFTIPSDNFTSIFFVDTLNGWATSRYIWQTTDGGNNWIQRTDIPIYFSLDVYFSDYLNGFILKSNQLYQSTDSGLTWILYPDVTGFSIAGKFSFYGNNFIFVTGYTTYRTTDAGENWVEISDLNGVRINGLNLLNGGLGFAVGEFGLILKYFDSTYVPVELTSFYSETIDNKVILSWQTASEINNQGFDIEKSKSGSRVWKRIGFVQGNGTTTEEHAYSYIDFVDEPGKYFYRLKQIDYNGSFEYSNIVEITVNSPSMFSLLQNYPNPFNNSTIISYQIPTDEFVTLKIYDILAKEIKTLVEENKKAGYYSISLNGNDLSSGIYFYKLIAGEYSSTKKFILLK